MNQAVRVKNFYFRSFFSDVFIYFISLSSIFCLILEGLKNKKWWPLVSAAIIGIFCFSVVIFKPNYCVTGFPVQFYAKCEGEGNLTPGFALFGFLVDFLFWFIISSILVAVLYKPFSSGSLKKFLIHKNIWFTIISAWITIIVISLLAAILRIKEFAGAGAVALVLLPFLSEIHRYFKKQHEGKQIFFSKVGYVALGISFALISVSLSFNLIYQSGWFDFRDFGFLLISYPLILITHFQPDVDVFSKRIILYLLSFVNLIVITYILDIIGAIVIGTYKFLRKTIQSIFTHF